MSGVLGVQGGRVGVLQLGDAQVGAEATVNAKGVSAHAVAAQTKIDDVVAAVILADKMETAASASVKLDAGNLRRRRGGVQAEGGDAGLTAGAPPSSTTGTRSGRAEQRGSRSARTAARSARVSTHLCAQVDKALGYKYGVQGVYKM